MINLDLVNIVDRININNRNKGIDVELFESMDIMVDIDLVKLIEPGKIIAKNGGVSITHPNPVVVVLHKLGVDTVGMWWMELKNVSNRNIDYNYISVKNRVTVPGLIYLSDTRINVIVDSYRDHLSLGVDKAITFSPSLDSRFERKIIVAIKLNKNCDYELRYAQPDYETYVENVIELAVYQANGNGKIKRRIRNGIK